MTRRTLEQEYIDVLVDSHVAYIGWGAGPSSVFCYDTHVSDLFGDGLTEQQWSIFRKRDRWVHENLRRLIDSGADPLAVAVERGHEIGRKVYCRYQMNHEYAPPSDDNFLWVGFVGSFNKQHPEFRVPGSTHLDFKYPDVREFKLSIIEEIVRTGVDAIMLDFTVYPPHSEVPDREIMTRFIRDARARIDSVTESGATELIVELPYRGSESMGLDWRRWISEGLIDVIVPTRMRGGETFDVRVDDFVEHAHTHGCRVWGFIWFALGFVSTDPMPSDDKTGARRYEKPKTRGMFFAQAHLFHRAGVDAIELVDSSGLAWSERPWYNELADPEAVRYADKHYTVDPKPFIPVEFRLPDAQPFEDHRSVIIRVADDVATAISAGYTVRSFLLLYARRLKADERVSIFINEHGPIYVDHLSTDGENDAPIDWRTSRPNWTDAADGTFVSDPEWWRRGEHRIDFDPKWLREGENTIHLVYECDVPGDAYQSSWIDLLIEYDRSGQ